MLRIEISNLELCRDILEQYTKSNCNSITSQDIIKIICEKLDITISNDYCYISDLLSYLLEKTTIVLDIRQVDIINIYVENHFLNHSIRFGNIKFFNDLMNNGVLPVELKNFKIRYILNIIKESRGSK